MDYWRNLQSNPDFIVTCYDALRELKVPEARQLIPKVLTRYLQNGVDAARKDFWLVSRLRQEFGDPWSVFLDDPKNGFESIFLSDLNKTSIRRSPRTVRLVQEGQTVILSSYTAVNGEAEVEIFYIDDKVNEYKFRININKPRIIPDIPEVARIAALRTIREYQRATQQYKADLTKALTVK
mgnify:FL=1